MEYFNLDRLDKDIASIKKRNLINKCWKKRKLKKSSKTNYLLDKKNCNKNKIPALRYKEYIKSHWWTERKRAYYKNNKKQCAACLSNKYINLHHIKYGNYGEEKDTALVPLCRECHVEYHEKYGVSKNMTSQTSIFIQEKRELLDFPIF